MSGITFLALAAIASCAIAPRLGISQPRSGEPLRNLGETKFMMGAVTYVENARAAKTQH